jgi:hypothetical protein
MSTCARAAKCRVRGGDEEARESIYGRQLEFDLTEIRKLTRAVVDNRQAGDRIVAMGAVTLAVRFTALDKYLSGGGALPRDWRTAKATVAQGRYG